MTTAEIHIASRALLHIAVLNGFAAAVEKTNNPMVKRKAARALYKVHGEPFGSAENAVRIWCRYRQATTIN